jgi:GNAT superfamily N-acetyltransferase
LNRQRRDEENMSEEIIVPFDVELLQLASCLEVHRQLRSSLDELTSKQYSDLLQQICQSKQSHICGIVKQSSSDTCVYALAVYRIHLTTFDGVRLEIHDFIVDKQQRGRGLGTRLVHYFIDQAKQAGGSSLVLQCNTTNTDAHRFFFRHNFTINSFAFLVNKCRLLPSNEQIRVVDITDLPEDENTRMLARAQTVYRQLRPHLPTNSTVFIKHIRRICQTGPARMLVAMNNDTTQTILGLALYRCVHNIKYNRHIYCDDLITDEQQRSAGVGRCLINAMKAKVHELGLDRLALESGCQRVRAHKFYHREGFHIDQYQFTLYF